MSEEALFSLSILFDTSIYLSMQVQILVEYINVGKSKISSFKWETLYIAHLSTSMMLGLLLETSWCVQELWF